MEATIEAAPREDALVSTGYHPVLILGFRPDVVTDVVTGALERRRHRRRHQSVRASLHASLHASLADLCPAVHQHPGSSSGSG